MNNVIKKKLSPKKLFLIAIGLQIIKLLFDNKTDVGLAIATTLEIASVIVFFNAIVIYFINRKKDGSRTMKSASGYEKLESTRKITEIGKIFLIIIVFIAAYLSVRFVASSYLYPEKSLEELLSIASVEINKNVPRQISEKIQLTGVKSSEKNLEYSYKFFSDTPEPDLQKELYLSTEKEIVKQVCTTAETRNLINKGATFIYKYFNKNEEYIFQVSVHLINCRILENNLSGK